MRLYLDTSALAKRYLQEIGSDEIKQFIFEAESVAISVVGKVEMFSALSRTSNFGLGEETIKLASQAFRDDFAGLIFLKLHDGVINLACETAYKYKIRGFDAIHLATAQLWMDEVDEMVQFCTYDHQLWHAAKKTKLRVLPENIKE